ncbi:MAG: hypothetical protein CBC42_07675 [Betaproteobacteria bacterium TMED82]|nr:MAG: hypothetical protein CBC42_07675 [Betaproteobacteria bacterium TMED82]|tara:strand:+ start:819 stop:1202 length:384 start_codon:yes stop_codon:yes gene_type:complete
MKKISIVLLLLYLTVNTSYSEWRKNSSDDEVDVLIDLGSVRLVDDGIKSIWVLKNFKAKASTIGSRQLKLEMDCESEEIRIKRRFTYSGKYLSGLPIKDYYKTEEWRSIDTDLHLRGIFEKICKRVK